MDKTPKFRVVSVLDEEMKDILSALDMIGDTYEFIELNNTTHVEQYIMKAIQKRCGVEQGFPYILANDIRMPMSMEQFKNYIEEKKEVKK